MTSRGQKRKVAITCVLEDVEALTARKNTKIGVLTVWSAILRNAAPWRIRLREHTSCQLNLVRSLNNMTVIAADAGNAIL